MCKNSEYNAISGTQHVSLVKLGQYKLAGLNWDNTSKPGKVGTVQVSLVKLGQYK